ncbi:MAG: HDIG domain-containing protein [Clostridia bacterium]|nr:HDIG domain-containing protein [Clostridia bacterium]
MRKRKSGRKRAGASLPIVLMGVLTYLILLVMLFAVSTPEQYDLRAGQVSPITITASKDVEDTVTTQQLIDEAMAAVPAIYRLDESVEPAALESLESSFDALSFIRQAEGEDMLTVTGSSLMTAARQAMPDLDWSEEDLALVCAMSDDTLASLQQDTLSIVQDLYDSLITEGGESEALRKLERELTARETYSEATVGLMSRIVSAKLKPNIVLDEETTQANRDKAASEVEPVIYIKGRNIVRSGEIITQTQIAMLESLGLLKSTRSIDVLMYAGVALLVLLVMVMLVTYMAIFEKEILHDAHKVALLCVIVLITCGVCMLAQGINQFLVPVALGVMLTTLLLKPRLALIVNIALAILSGLINSGVSGSFSTSLIIILMTSIISGSLSIALIYNKSQRLVVLLAGLLVCGSNMLTTLAVGLITETNTTNVGSWALWSGASGLLAGILCIGLQPVLEWVFNLVTPAKLMELSNPNHPLIRRMILEASGTYHHSIIVANLAEAAADAIGANGLLARVGAYYHDIGKLKRPMYFKENQMGDNPHDRTDPMVSAAILTAHPTDGVALAEKYRMPKPILDIIQQHHGDTPVIYFYDRCVKQNGAENVDIDDFRYPGPCPQTREAAVVMLADTIEAAARTTPDRSIEGLEALIRKLIRGKMDDGQLSETPMTLADVEKATEAFLTVLSGVFHQRVEYPEMKIPPKKERGRHEKADPADGAAEKKEKRNA